VETVAARLVIQGNNGRRACAMWCSRAADRPRLEGDRGAIDAHMPARSPAVLAPSLAARSASCQVLKPRQTQARSCVSKRTKPWLCPSCARCTDPIRPPFQRLRRNAPRAFSHERMVVDEAWTSALIRSGVAFSWISF